MTSTISHVVIPDSDLILVPTIPQVAISSWGMNDFEPARNNLINVFIFVLEKAEGKGDVVPATLSLAPRQPGGQFLGELLRMFVL